MHARRAEVVDADAGLLARRAQAGGAIVIGSIKPACLASTTGAPIPFSSPCGRAIPAANIAGSANPAIMATNR